MFAVSVLAAAPAHGAGAAIPTRLSDRDYWVLIQSFSEAGGAFVSDNLVSNELAYQQAVPMLQRLPRGRA